MKKTFKSFYQKNRITLGLIAFSIISLLITILLLGVFIASKPEAIINFVETSNITQEILPFSLLSMVAILLGLFLMGLVVFLLVKNVFPSKETISKVVMKDEIDFLIDLPSRIGREVFKNGK